MSLWIFTIVLWILSGGCIIYVMVEVFRKKKKVLSPFTIGGVLFHGVTALIVLFLLFKLLKM
ncbi:MAG: hypothetical protein SVW57_02370 [Thermodesulfobacteriota bacterium]|nr:hypothetical protein [Thermodesulfobacteriota bacterium]